MARKLAIFDAAVSGGSATPWVTDGTAAGTFVLADVIRFSGRASGSTYIPAVDYALLDSGRAIFVARSKTDLINYGIYVSDGTIAGTQRLASIGAVADQQIQLTSLSDGRVMFLSTYMNYTAGNTGGSTATGALWVTDGTAVGTVVTKNFSYTGAQNQIRPDLVSIGNGRATFTLAGTLQTSQFYTTDGTTAGTAPLLAADGKSFAATFFVTPLSSGRALFRGTESDFTSGLFVTNGTAAGTTKVNDLTIRQPVSLGNGKVMFFGDIDTYTNSGLYVSDGTSAGTTLLKPFSYLAYATLTAVSPGIVAYAAGAMPNASGESTAIEIFLSDGTVAGTRSLKLIQNVIVGPQPQFSPPRPVTATGFTTLGDGRFLFRVSNGTGEGSLWISDATAAGTVQVDTTNIATDSFDPDNFTATGDGTAVFAATTLNSQGQGIGHELWTTNGTTAGTMLVKDINPGIPSSGISNVTALVATTAPFVFKIVPLDANKPDQDGGTTPFTFTVTRTGDTSGAGSVAYSAAGSGANPLPPGVITNPSGLVTFAAGSATATLTITLQGAQIATTDTFAVQLGGAVANDPNATATGIVQPTPAVINLDPLFDIAYYLAHVTGVAASAAYAHFLSTGWKLGLDPSAYFSTSYYLAQNADVRALGINPLLHYEQSGAAQGRDPSAAFSTTDYLAANPDVKAAGLSALQHYITNGRAEGRLAIAPGVRDPGVDAAAYYAANPDVRAAGVDAATHYNLYGWREGRNPNAFFDTKFYLAQNPDVKAAGVDPLTHFETVGWKEGRDPSPAFSDARYLAAYADVKAAGINPLLHYLTNGRAEGRMAFLPPQPTDPIVDAAYYDRQAGITPSSDPVAAALQAAAAYNSNGWQRGLNPSALFDTAYYLAQNPDVAAAHVNPLLHFEAYGWREGRNPSAAFSTAKYLAAYADVRAAGADPLVHFVQYGQAEGRTAFTV